MTCSVSSAPNVVERFSLSFGNRKNYVENVVQNKRIALSQMIRLVQSWLCSFVEHTKGAASDKHSENNELLDEFKMTAFNDAMSWFIFHFNLFISCVYKCLALFIKLERQFLLFAAISLWFYYVIKIYTKCINKKWNS